MWRFNGEDIVVCDDGLKWLSILPQNDFYCITAMMNANDDILVWYIDMIVEQGIDAVSKKDIPEEQFELAIATSKKLQKGLLSDIKAFIDYTLRCKRVVE